MTRRVLIKGDAVDREHESLLRRLAHVYMDTLLESMELNELGVLRRRVVLSDGSTLVLRASGGQEIATIYTPTAEIPEKKKDEKEDAKVDFIGGSCVVAVLYMREAKGERPAGGLRDDPGDAQKSEVWTAGKILEAIEDDQLFKKVYYQITVTGDANIKGAKKGYLVETYPANQVAASFSPKDIWGVCKWRDWAAMAGDGYPTDKDPFGFDSISEIKSPQQVEVSAIGTEVEYPDSKNPMVCNGNADGYFGKPHRLTALGRDNQRIVKLPNGKRISIMHTVCGISAWSVDDCDTEYWWLQYNECRPHDAQYVVTGKRCNHWVWKRDLIVENKAVSYLKCCNKGGCFEVVDPSHCTSNTEKCVSDCNKKSGLCVKRDGPSDPVSSGSSPCLEYFNVGACIDGCADAVATLTSGTKVIYGFTTLSDPYQVCSQWVDVLSMSTYTPNMFDVMYESTPARSHPPYIDALDIFHQSESLILEESDVFKSAYVGADVEENELHLSSSIIQPDSYKMGRLCIYGFGSDAYEIHIEMEYTGGAERISGFNHEDFAVVARYENNQISFGFRQHVGAGTGLGGKVYDSANGIVPTTEETVASTEMVASIFDQSVEDGTPSQQELFSFDISESYLANQIEALQGTRGRGQALTPEQNAELASLLDQYESLIDSFTKYSWLPIAFCTLVPKVDGQVECGCGG
jgi:hypothetical protein